MPETALDVTVSDSAKALAVDTAKALAISVAGTVIGLGVLRVSNAVAGKLHDRKVRKAVETLDEN